MSPAKEVLEEDALLAPTSPGATVPASRSGEGGRRPGRSRSSRKQSAGTPAPPCSGSPGANTAWWLLQLSPLFFITYLEGLFRQGGFSKKHCQLLLQETLPLTCLLPPLAAKTQLVEAAAAAVQ